MSALYALGWLWTAVRSAWITFSLKCGTASTIRRSFCAAAIVEAFASEALGPYAGPGRGLAGLYGRTLHREKIKAVIAYLIDFVCIHGWPPDGPHLIRVRFDGQERYCVVTFPRYHCQLSPGLGRALIRRISTSARDDRSARQWALERLEASAPLLTACLRAKAAEVTREQLQEAAMSRLESCVVLIVVGGIIVSGAATVVLALVKVFGMQ